MYAKIFLAARNHSIYTRYPSFFKKLIEPGTRAILRGLEKFTYAYVG